MLEIKNPVVVVVFIFLKHNDLFGRFADPNDFLHMGINTVHKFSCMRNAVTVHGYNHPCNL